MGGIFHSVANISESARTSLRQLRGIAVPRLRGPPPAGCPHDRGSVYADSSAELVRRGDSQRDSQNTVERLSADIAQALQLPEVKDILGKEGLAPAATSPQEFDAFMRAEMQRNELIIRALKLKIE